MPQLPPEKFYIIGKFLESTPFNYLFAISVVDRHVKGTIFVDDMENP